LTLVVADQTEQSRYGGVPVTWQVATGGGTILPGSPFTDANGTASAFWILGPTVGTQSVTFRVPGYNPTTLSATAATVRRDGCSIGPRQRHPETVLASIDAVKGLSPGVIASVFGTNLSSAPAAGRASWTSAGTNSLTTSYNGMQVTSTAFLRRCSSSALDN